MVWYGGNGVGSVECTRCCGQAKRMTWRRWISVVRSRRDAGQSRGSDCLLEGHWSTGIDFFSLSCCSDDQCSDDQLRHSSKSRFVVCDRTRWCFDLHKVGCCILSCLSITICWHKRIIDLLFSNHIMHCHVKNHRFLAFGESLL